MIFPIFEAWVDSCAVVRLILTAFVVPKDRNVRICFPNGRRISQVIPVHGASSRGISSEEQVRLLQIPAQALLDTQNISSIMAIIIEKAIVKFVSPSSSFFQCASGKSGSRHLKMPTSKKTFSTIFSITVSPAINR